MGSEMCIRDSLLKAREHGVPRVVERPQYMWMRVALGIHDEDFKDALETYDLMSKKYFTHATPTYLMPELNMNKCLHVISYQWKMIVLTEFITLSRIVP